MRIANMIGAVLRQELNRNRHGVAKLDLLFRPNGGLEREKIAPAFLVWEDRRFRKGAGAFPRIAKTCRELRLSTVIPGPREDASPGMTSIK
jgi:hypothetical protein